MSPTYGEYLKLEELLKLQTGIDGDESKLSNDELHFIIVHQNFELWFKLIISELRCTRDILDTDYVEETKIPQAVHHMGRLIETLRLMALQWKVVETLEPQDFLNFRDKLDQASGFESFQMRKMEALMGEIWVDGKPVNSKAWESFKEQRSLYDVICDWLHRTPIQGSVPGSSSDDKTVSNFVDSFIHNHTSLYPDGNSEAQQFLKPDGNVHRGRSGLLFIESYRELPLLAWPRKLISTLIELEEAMVLWRSSHARMVERVIGRRVGTGGSSGVDYLDMTTKYRVFVDLWSVRSILIKKSALPELQSPEFYGFKGD